MLISAAPRFTVGRVIGMRWIAVVVAMAAALAVAAPASASAPSVVGGTPAAFAAAPWSVALLDAYTSDRRDAEMCGGALIAPNVVLTAAHCLYDSDGWLLDAEDVNVLTGTSLLSGTFGDRSPVVGGIVQGGAEDIWDANDLAVLWVQHTSPLAVPLAPATFAQWFAFRVGSRVTVTGWGANRVVQRRAWFPHKLKQYAGVVRTKSRGFLLVRSLGSSACFGDSGGAAVGTDAAGTPFLVGVVHAGRLDCAVGQSVMFVNVAAQEQFIAKALAAGPNPGPGVGLRVLRRAG
jgi:secreted trypsin-like serine protease